MTMLRISIDGGQAARVQKFTLSPPPKCPLGVVFRPQTAKMGIWIRFIETKPR